MAKPYLITLSVTVEDGAKLLAAARRAAMRNGFRSEEEYDAARGAAEDPIGNDLMEIVRIDGIDFENGVCPGELSIAAETEQSS